MCKNSTSYIFSLYLKAPQTWYNLFPSTSSILLVLFISSLLTFIPVVFFSFFFKFVLQFCALESFAIFRKHFAFFFGYFYVQKTGRSKIFQFFLSPSDGNSRRKTSCDVLHDNEHVQNFKFPAYFADHSRKGRRRAIGQMASIRGTYLAPFVLGI